MRMDSPASSNWTVSATAFVLAAATFCWFLIDGGLIEIGGDAYGRWEDLSNNVRSGKALGFNHHGTRWGINLPILMFLKAVNSTHPLLYHMIMPVFGAGTAVALYLVVRPEASTPARDIGAALLIFAFMVTSPSERPFSQLLPMGAATFYLSASVLFLKYAWSSDSNYRLGHFLLAGVFCLCAYGTKLTLIWFAIPLSFVAFVTRIAKRDFLSVGVFFAPVIVGLLVEVVVMYLGTGSFLGRAVNVLSSEGSHGVRSLGRLPSSADFGGWGFGTFWEYIFKSPQKFYEALGGYAWIIYFAVLHSLSLRVRSLGGSSQASFEAVMQWTLIGFFLLQSYGVVHLSPYIFPEQSLHARYQYALLALSVTYLSLRLLTFSQRDQSKTPTAVLSKPLLLPMLLLVASFALLANPLFSKHNNYGILVTLIHNKVLTEWIDHGGLVGFRGEIVESGEVIDVEKSMQRSPNQHIVSDYVRSIYRREYCEPDAAFVYRDHESVYGLCQPWTPGSSVLIYYATSYEFVRPEHLSYLGKYSDIVE